MFQPKLFIGIGATNAYYTLRETYLHEVHIPGEGEERSFHHYNLSQDADEAIAKATEASREMGIPFECTKEDIEQEMRDIKRADAEEMERRRAAYEAQQKEWEAERAIWKTRQFETINAGFVSFGKYAGEAIETLPRGYLDWLVTKLPEFDEGSLLRELATVVRDHFAAYLPPKADPNKHIGEVGERLTLNVDVTRVSKYERPHAVAHWKMETVYIITMVTDDGACLVSKSTSFYAHEGDKLHIKATVKAHDDYKGQAQTVVQRIKIIENAEKKAA